MSVKSEKQSIMSKIYSWIATFDPKDGSNARRICIRRPDVAKRYEVNRFNRYLEGGDADVEACYAFILERLHEEGWKPSTSQHTKWWMKIDGAVAYFIEDIITNTVSGGRVMRIDVFHDLAENHRN